MRASSLRLTFTAIVRRTGVGVVPAAGVLEPAGLPDDRNHRGVKCLGLVADHNAVLELDHPFAHFVDDVVVVGGHDHRGAILVDLVQHSHDAHGGGGVQVS